MKNLSLIILSALTLCSCNLLQDRIVVTDDNRIPVARVGDHMLYETDLRGLVSTGSSEDDSIVAVHNYIETWVRQKLMVDLAENQLIDETGDIEERLVKYRESLFTYQYEQEYLNQNLDTVIQDDKIQAYFDQYAQNFVLTEHIGKFISVTIQDDYPKQDSIKYWLDNIDEEFFHLQKYCVETSAECWLQEDVWKSYSEIGQIIDGVDLNQLVKGQVSIQTYGENINYVLLLDFVPANQVAPLVYKRDEITKILINKRRIALIKELHDDVYEDAIRKRKFEIY